MDPQNTEPIEPENQPPVTTPLQDTPAQEEQDVAEKPLEENVVEESISPQADVTQAGDELALQAHQPPEATTVALGAAQTPTKKPQHAIKKLLSNRAFLFTLIGILLIAATLVLSYKLTRPDATQQLTTTEQTVTDTAEQVAIDTTTADAANQTQDDYLKIAYPSETEAYDTQMQKFLHPTTGETWLAAPKKIANQGWISGESTAEDPLSYQEVGARANNTIYLVTTMIGTPGQSSNLFEKSPSGKVTIVLRPQKRAALTVSTVNSVKEKINNQVVTVDDTIHYDSLNVPEKLPIGDDEYATLAADGMTIGDNQSTESDSTLKTLPVATFGQSALSRLERNFADTKLTNIGYQAKTPIGTFISMRYEPNSTSLKGYTFTNGASTDYKDYQNKVVTDDIGAIARGCSLLTASVTRSDGLTLDDLVYIGKTPTGRIIYEPKDKDGALYKKAYEEYAQMRDKDAQPKSQYINDHGLLVIPNNKKELLVYTRGQYSAVGGCAKPIVYLYPTAPTAVSVKVGANVTVSDPLYPVSGWKNVWARPNGQLTYRGKSYDSLFWEGQGYGDYPGIVSGTVVKRADVVKTIRAQLAAQGLNAKETKDFMTFWEPKIPNKHYVRLTWLNTSQMNRLAPLTISPKPQTLIRVFLDMDGLDTPITLPAQQLIKVERKGFTVVEWGGLTVEGLR